METRSVEAGIGSGGSGGSDGWRHASAQAYRDGSLVCSRVRVTRGPDGRLVARFEDRLDLALRAELEKLARECGAAARNAAARMQPIVLMVGDPHHGRERITGRIVPPWQACHGDLRDIPFGLRQLAS